MDKDSEYLTKFMKLAEAAEFYLRESFNYLHQCAESELAGVIFKEMILLVSTTKEDQKIDDTTVFPDGVIETLTEDHPEVLSEKTHGKIDHAWERSQELSGILGHNFHKTKVFDSIELLGHVGNFAFFFETLVNRHLLFLLLSNRIDNFTYNNLSRSKLLTRLTYIFKDELVSNVIDLNEIANLFRLRNKTVHFTPDNAIQLEVKIDALIRIWNQVMSIVSKFQKIEKFNEQQFSTIIEHEINEFNDRWTNKENTEVDSLIKKIRLKVTEQAESKKDDD